MLMYQNMGTLSLRDIGVTDDGRLLGPRGWDIRGQPITNLYLP